MTGKRKNINCETVDTDGAIINVKFDMARIEIRQTPK